MLPRIGAVASKKTFTPPTRTPFLGHGRKWPLLLTLLALQMVLSLELMGPANGVVAAGTDVDD